MRFASVSFVTALAAAGSALVTIPVVAVAGETTGSALAIGAKLPALATKMKNVDGKLVSIADVGGKAGTLVVFTCNHCPFAKGWEERIVDLGNSYAKKGVGVILINANDPATHEEDGFAEMQTRAKSRGLQVPYVVDETSAVARAFGASVTPEAFLFDRKGKLVYHGAVDDNHKEPDKVQKRYLKDALDAVVAGKPPATPETKGIGCGIKFRKV
ncbi:MAG: thioredoxin family protein [Pseudomonadota bacterium]